MSVQETVFSVLAAKTYREPCSIRPEETFADLGLDSVMLLEVLFVLEETFDIDISLSAATLATPHVDAIDVATLCSEVERLCVQRRTQ